MANDLADTGDEDFETADQGYAAYLMTKYTFLGAIDTGQAIGKGKYGTKKSFTFLVPTGVDMDQELFDYQNGLDNTKVPAVVMFNKMRLIRDHCKRPIDMKVVA